MPLSADGRVEHQKLTLSFFGVQIDLLEKSILANVVKSLKFLKNFKRSQLLIMDSKTTLG